MTMNKDGVSDGGAAFPRMTQKYNDIVEVAAHGMSLRDYFAAQAISAAWEVAMTFRPPDDSQSPEQYCATQAYAIADAMIAEGSK